jgi:hypothetical protein
MARLLLNPPPSLGIRVPIRGRLRRRLHRFGPRSSWATTAAESARLLASDPVSTRSVLEPGGGLRCWDRPAGCRFCAWMSPRVAQRLVEVQVLRADPVRLQVVDRHLQAQLVADDRRAVEREAAAALLRVVDIDRPLADVKSRSSPGCRKRDVGVPARSMATPQRGVRSRRGSRCGPALRGRVRVPAESVGSRAMPGVSALRSSCAAGSRGVGAARALGRVRSAPPRYRVGGGGCPVPGSVHRRRPPARARAGRAANRR